MGKARFCSNCGANVEPGDRFCGSCGNPQHTFPPRSRTSAKDGLGLRSRRSGLAVVVTGAVVLAAIVYIGTAWYAGSQVAQRLQVGKIYPIAPELGYQVTSFHRGWFQSHANGELVLQRGGVVLPILPVQQQIFQGWGSGGSVLRIHTTLLPGSHLYSVLTEPHGPVQWHNPVTPIDLRTRIFPTGQESSMLEISDGQLQTGHLTLQWRGVDLHGRQRGEGGWETKLQFAGIHAEDDGTIVALGPTHWSSRYQPGAAEDLLRSRLQVGASEIAGVPLQRIDEKTTVLFPQALVQDLGQSNPGILTAHAQALNQIPITQHTELNIQGQGDTRLQGTLYFHGDTAGFSTAATSPGAFHLPRGDVIQMHVQLSHELTKKLLVFFLTRQEQYPDDAMVKVMAQRVEHSLQMSGVLMPQDGKDSVELEADHAGMTINGKPANDAISTALLRLDGTGSGASTGSALGGIG